MGRVSLEGWVGMGQETRMNIGKKTRKGFLARSQAECRMPGLHTVTAAGPQQGRVSGHSTVDTVAVKRDAHPSTCQALFSSLEAWPIALGIYLAHGL